MLEFLQNYSYLGLFVILFVEEAGIFLPVPGDLFIAATSALPNSNYFLIILTVTLATLLGSTLLFTLSRTFGSKLLIKYGKFIKVDAKKVKKLETWFEKYGGFAIVFGRLIPGLRIVTPIAAGLFNVGYKAFWLYTAISALIWANIYFFVGKFFYDVLNTLNLY